ncbi:MAG: TolC family protein [Deltaproteobacteria bacterium]|jgi:outer membrane protein|nr:TolC family protein [Deltaproteobacteria bacterium]
MHCARNRLMAGIALVLAYCLLPSAALAAEEARFDMKGAVSRALKENFTVSAAAHGAEAAESGRKAARGAFGPSLGTTYGYERREDRFALGTAREQDKDLFSWKLWLRQNVFAGFSSLNAYQKAVLQKENADLGVSKARLELIGTVQENFLRLLQAAENTRSAKDSLERLKSQLKVTTAFYEVGLKPRLDVLQAEVDVATAEDSLLQSINAYETQLSRLNTLLVLPVEAETAYMGSLAYIPFTRGFDECLRIAFLKRPDLIMARKAVAIADKDVGIARSGFYPRVDAEGGWTTQGSAPSASGSDILPERHQALTFNITGEWTAFSSGTTYYSVRQAKQIKNLLAAEEMDLRQGISHDVKSRLLKISETAKRIKVAQKGLDQAKEAYRMADALYQAQVGIFIDVLDAQAKLTQAEAALTGAQADYLIALALLHVAIGEENPALLPIQ